MLESYLHKTRMKKEDSCLIMFSIYLKMQRSGQKSYPTNDNNQKPFKGLVERFLHLNLRRHHIQLISMQMMIKLMLTCKLILHLVVRREERKKKQEKG